MFLTYGNLMDAVLIALGLWWCKEIWDRRDKDWRDVRDPPDQVRRWVVVLIWMATAVILALICRFAWNLGSALYHAFF
jgi:hypothetical protein